MKGDEKICRKIGKGKFLKILKREEGVKMLHYYRKTEKDFEYCFNIETSGILTDAELGIIRWLLAETFEPDNFDDGPFLKCKKHVVEVGPRLNFATAWNTNALSVLRACGITKVTRLERSRRYIVPSGQTVDQFIQTHCDRMTEMVYENPLVTFETGIVPEAVYEIPLLEKGPDVLLDYGINDPQEREYYFWYYKVDEKRNPTNVEIKDLQGSNSEHSRHGYFKGVQIIDGEFMKETLMQIVQSTLTTPNNSVIAFSDNSSAIRGYEITTIIPEHPGKTSCFVKSKFVYHIIFTAETHNFPSGVAPFPGAETGTGGRIRDDQATGKGGLVVAGTAAYCVGNLNIPGYDLPWEDKSFIYPDNLASPLKILIDASNGASDYGNKFGEPVIQGFVESFGLKLPNGERREWLKPIMFTGGIGQIPDGNTKKDRPEIGMRIVQIGGPAYHIGVGGGFASSLIQGEQAAKLDFDAVQRGDAEMEQKVNRVVRACVEMGILNLICSIHDQGALGPANVLKELVEKAGGRIELRKIRLGDNTLPVVVIWIGEYQERLGLLIDEDRINDFIGICDREKVPYEILGEVTGDGRFVVHDSKDDSTPVNFDLAKVLGNLPQKTFSDTRIPAVLKPLEFPKDLTVREALELVLKLVSVGSKRFLTNKVDRSVTGLVAQQQCVGPLQLPLSNVSVVAQSHFGLTGAAMAIGARSRIGLINPEAQGRMTVAEMLTNIVWAKISKLEDIKCSGNWMWAPKLLGEGAKLNDAAVTMRYLMLELGIAIDGGKDSLSMAAKVGKEIVKSPGQLVLSGYCTMPDIRKVITLDIKKPGESRLLLMCLAGYKNRLGGSALAQVFGQVGDECPDIEDPELFKKSILVIQQMIDEDLILSGHDRSDGGLITTLLEMAFVGNCGLKVDALTFMNEVIPYLFAEEAGVVIEYDPKNVKRIAEILLSNKLYAYAKDIGRTTKEKVITVSVPVAGRNEVVFSEDMRVLRQIWEETSHQLECLQCNPQCAAEEKKNIFDRSGMKFRINFEYGPTAPEIVAIAEKPKVAIIREEGSNGDREMTSAFYQAGFECWDVTMTDLLEGRITPDGFRGITFVGGFSYADVLDSAKGWAGVIRFNEKLRAMFNKFYNRPDTFSLGVCNGCQLMALLGWVPWRGIPDEIRPRFIKNKSGRFESRFSAVHIQKSPAIMLKGMEGSTLGVWVAHGEGRMHFPDERILDDIFSQSLAPIRFVDDNNTIAENGKYPFNPNDSPYGITGLCSLDGRHLAMMPHPERAFLKWQWAYKPDDWKNTPNQVAPWLQMFQNARIWCEQTK